jgi:hypothetical protein
MTSPGKSSELASMLLWLLCQHRRPAISPLRAVLLCTGEMNYRIDEFRAALRLLRSGGCIRFNQRLPHPLMTEIRVLARGRKLNSYIPCAPDYLERMLCGQAR